MKLSLLTFIFAQLITASAFAGTYVCLAQEGSEYADAALVFNVENSALIQTSKEMVVEDGLEEALEDALVATDVKVMTARCPHCYTVSGTIMGAYELTLNIRDTKGSFSIKYGDEESSNSPSGNLDCSFTK